MGPAIGIVAGCALLLVGLVSQEAPCPAARCAKRPDGFIPAVLVADTSQNGLKWCARQTADGPAPPFDPAFWSCANTDDMFLILHDTGRGYLLEQVLGLKVGPPNGFDHLVGLAGGKVPIAGGAPTASAWNAGQPWFKSLVLWNDADRDMRPVIAELAAFAFTGYREIRSELRLKVAEPDAHGNVVVQRGMAALGEGAGARQVPIAAVQLAGR